MNSSVGGELAFAGNGGRRADQYEREDAVGVVEREQLRERPSGRDTHDVRGRDPVGIEHAGGVTDQVRAGVSGTARLVGDRPAGVAVVVTDHEAPALGEQPAKTRLPPEHRSPQTHHEQDGWIGRVAEGLGAERDAVRIHDVLSHRCFSSPAVRGVRCAGPWDRW